jgi:hypothetical protein
VDRRSLPSRYLAFGSITFGHIDDALALPRSARHSAGFIESCVPLARWHKFGKTTTGIFTCPHCGAVYEVTYTRLAAADHDWAICVPQGDEKVGRCLLTLVQIEALDGPLARDA